MAGYIHVHEVYGFLTVEILIHVCLCAYRLSGYGFINVGLPPASPSESEEDVVSCRHHSQSLLVEWSGSRTAL